VVAWIMSDGYRDSHFRRDGIVRFVDDISSAGGSWGLKIWDGICPPALSPERVSFMATLCVKLERLGCVFCNVVSPCEGAGEKAVTNPLSRWRKGSWHEA